MTGVVEAARRRLDLAPIAAIAFGRCAAAAAMLLRMSAKLPLRLELDARGDGPLARVLAEVGVEGDIRGLVSGAQVAGLDGPQDLRVGPVLGKGVLQVRRYGMHGSSYESQVELVTSEIGGDVAHYLSQSEQRRSAVLVGVLVRPEGIEAAGGLIVEALPEAEKETVHLVEKEIAALSSVSRLVADYGIDGMVGQVLGELDPERIETQEVRYSCRCDRARITSKLCVLTREELEELTEADGTLEAECAFCGEVYRLRLEELLPS